MTSYSKKKPAKIMINGWRSDSLIAGEFKMLELSEMEKHGKDFIKAELLDSIMKLGMGALKNGKVITPIDMMIEPEKPKPKAKRFVKPGQYDCEELFLTKGSTCQEAEKFFNYYESNGWRVGKNPMKNWKAAAANWMKNNHASGGRVGKPAVDQSAFLKGGTTGDGGVVIDGHVIPNQQEFLSHDG